jgi:hypothetical protein
VLHFFTTSLFAQVDFIRFSKDQLIVGEIKSMNKGVLVVETDFSEADFEIEWKKVRWINTQTRFLVMFNDGSKYYGVLSSVDDSTSLVKIDGHDGFKLSLSDIIYMDAYNDKFGDRFHAELSVGFDMAKARNITSLSSRTLVGYKTEKWTLDASLNSLTSNQDSTEQIQRIDGSYNQRYIYKGLWYGIASITTLSNTEQNLSLRLNTQLGVGRFITYTNRSYWGLKIGLNHNREDYSNETANRLTWEGYLGTELNLFDLGDISLLFAGIAYPGFTELGRFRSDLRLDLKYKLPLNFFIKIGTSINFDNRPAEDASNVDYVLQSTFGWEW